MRMGIAISLTPADQARLGAVVSDGNTPQKHVCRAQIVLLSAGGAGNRDFALGFGTWHRGLIPTSRVRNEGPRQVPRLHR